MSTLGDFLTGMVQRSHQGTQDRAALNTLAQFSDDQDSDATDKLAQRGKQASALRKVIQSYSDNPDLGHAINGLGVDDLEGILHGMALNSAMRAEQSQIQQRQAETAWTNQRSQESADEGDATGQLMRAYGDIRQADPTIKPGDAMMQAFGQVGKVNPRAGAALLKTFAPQIMDQQDLTNGTFSVPQTGATFVTRGKQILPAGFDPAVTGAGKPVPQTDPDGNLIGYSITDMRGHSTFHPAKGSAKLKQATDQNGNAIDGFFMDDSGKLHDTRDAMDKQGYEMLANPDGSFKFQPKAKAAAAASGEPAASPPGAVPKVGEVRKGYKFKGGNPADKNNWEKQ